MKLVLLLMIAGFCSGAFEKPVQVTIDAKWKATPLVLEAGEFLAKEGLYEKFADSLHNPEHLKDIENDRSWYQYMLKVASRFLSPARVKLLEFTLSLRVYSPKIQLHQQLAELELSGTETSCAVFAVYANQIYCIREDFDLAVKESPDSKQSLYPTDYSHCVSNCGLCKDTPIIVYGELGSLELVKFLQKPLPLYTVLRSYIKEPEDRKVRLSGYGVELAIKSTEYKAHDDSKQELTEDDDEPLEGEISGFNFTRLGERYRDLQSGLRKLKNKLSESSNELKPLKVWQLQDLSYQAAEKGISSSDKPIVQLETIRDISQNLPSQSASLAEVPVSESFRNAVTKGQKEIMDNNALSPGDNVLYINGVTIDMDTMDIFTIYDILKQDLSVMEQLSQHGVTGNDAGELLKSISSKKSQEYALDIRDSSIIYINDLEKDDMYARWPRTLNALLQPTFPGMMRHVARNMFHLVYVFDIMDVGSVENLTFMLSLYAHSTPVRVGLVPVVTVKPDDNDEMYETATLLVKSFHKLIEEKGGSDALQSLMEVYVDGGEKITLEHVRQEMKSLVGNLEEVMDDEEYTENMEKANHFYRRSGLGPLPHLLMNGVPLTEISPVQIEETVITEVLQSTPSLQRAVYHSKLTDNMNVLDWLMQQDHVVPRLNSRVLAASTNPETCVKPLADVETSYLTKKTDDTVKEISMLVITDVDTVEGRSMVYNAIKYVKYSAQVRLSILPNPSSFDPQSPASPLLAAVVLAQEILSNADAKNFITKLVKEENAVDFISGKKTVDDLSVSGMDVEKFKSDLEKFSFNPSPLLAQLSIKPGRRAVLSAGRLIGPLEDGEEFTQDDFDLLEKIVDKSMVDKVVKAVKKLKFDSHKSSSVVSSLVSALSCVSSTEDRPRSAITVPHSDATVMVPPTDSEAPAFEIQALLDPLSRAAQKILPLLLVLPRVVNAKMEIFLNCREKLSELPVKSFYRYVLEPEVQFNVVGGLTAGAQAHFDKLPHKSVLTMNILSPESWLVESVHAVHDLDNIKLEQTKSGVMAGYELEYLLIEGHCYDSNTGQPPRGLEFLLGNTNSAESATVDTIVMANLGYFQLKANPGVWYLMIRPGRSDELYQVTSHSEALSFTDGDDIVLVMDSFDSKIISMRVKKREGMEMEELLVDEGKEEEEESGGIWNSISSSLSGVGTPSEETDENLNIFSVASGHLYERLMRIMILSIMSQTKSPVKFWLLKNYLSPEFKDFIPVMAEKYGFKYELIQYKWPRWLHQQTEKQRVMWGYKILFLDVLFPLNIKKVAFIDADQIVRTDIRELFELDLGGAPYGYTPFCSDRKEMDGFRFWKSGYWASHLGHRPYHISALYIIDLKKFRKIAAGDRLRGQYQALSQDPNSLSNLDQDLPNNMIHQVKIKSLPQEWLWCETWCSNDSKTKAKTIDLCNNPLTKEPKLVAARRIVPEWTTYDEEIKELWDIWKGDENHTKLKADNSASSKQPKHTEL